MRERQWSIVNGEWLMLAKKALLIAFSLSYILTSSGQQVSTIISKEKIVLGEQISLKIKVQGISPASIKHDFVFPDTINHIEILSDTIKTVNSSTILYDLTLTSFDSGYWQLPGFEIILMDNRKLVTESIGITVMPVDVSTLVDYHDIKDILEVNAENNWWIVTAIVALALLSLFGFLWFHNTRTTAKQNIIPVANLYSMYNELLQQISKLEDADFSDKFSAANIYKASSNSIRTFTDAAYRQNTSHLTTGEYMLRIKGKFPDAATENIYFQFLRLSDAVKFAKYTPPVEETKTVFPILRSVAGEVYQQNKAKN